MKKILFILLLSLGTLVYANQPKNELSPIGFWKTIDDVSGKPKAIVQLWESSNKELFGRIIRLFPEPGRTRNELCTECKGERHNQRILGMVFLENLKPDKEHQRQWIDGTILDPKNGKVYHSKLQISQDGRELKVRGYIGIPLFGRSQTWFRVVETNKTS